MAKALRANPLRNQILQHLTRKPGMNRNQLRKALDISLNTVNFHIERLEEAGLVHTRPSGRGDEMLCFTKENVHFWDDESTRVLYGRGSARQVALYLADHPGAKTDEIAHALQMSIDSVRYQIRTLENHDLIQRLRIDHEVFYHAEHHLENWANEVAKDCVRRWKDGGRVVG